MIDHRFSSQLMRYLDFNWKIINLGNVNSTLETNMNLQLPMEHKDCSSISVSFKILILCAFTVYAEDEILKIYLKYSQL